MTNQATAISKYGKNGSFVISSISRERAEYGKAAHSLLSLKIRKIKGEFDNDKQTAIKEYSKLAPRLRQRETELVEAAEDMIIDLVMKYSKDSEHLELHSEYPISLTPILPVNTGNADVVIETDEVIHIIDLKTGTTYEEEDSPQLKLYGVGAFLDLATEQTKYIKTSVIQDGEIRTKTFEAMNLVDEVIDEGRVHAEFENSRLENSEIAQAIQTFTTDMSFELLLNRDNVDDETLNQANTLKWVTRIIFRKAENKAQRGHEFDDYGITEGNKRRVVEDMVGAVNWLTLIGYSKEEINDTRLNVRPLEKLLSDSQFEVFSQLFIEERQAKESFKRKRL